ncbi:MAG: HEAT repeat domain-containing protein [Myxococcaceae bacterium]|nr:HEAT repeat domain-containing protein [Myxococcaceae bacterium]MCA3011272.1 HEAT repeat domain-containing protein [Myxococcaceae bacterium]
MVARVVGMWVCLALGACTGDRDQHLAQLQSPRPDDRAIAVKKLAQRFEPDDLLLFTQAARDPVGMVRAEAMTALGRSNDERVVDLLGEALGDPDDVVQVAAARALANVRNDKARTYLTLQYLRRGRSTRQVIVEGLKSANVPGAMASCVVAEAKGLWEKNLKALEDGALPERVGAAEELGRSGRPEAVNRLVPLLKAKNVVLAAAAARGLGFARDARAVPALTELLDENFPELREAACEALGKLKEPAARQKLGAVALEQSTASVLATQALIALPPSDEVNQVLCSVLVGGGGPEVEAAGRELRRRGGCPVEPLLERLRSGAPNAALRALIALGPALKEHSTKVAPLLSAADPTTRRLAVEAIGELQHPPSAAAVLKALEAELKAVEPLRADWIPDELPLRFAPGFDPDSTTPDPRDVSRGKRARAAEVLRRTAALDAQRLKERGKVPLQARAPTELVDDGSEEQYQLLAALLRAIGRLRVEGARARLEPFTVEPSPTLRSAAIAGLGLLGKDAVPAVKGALLDSERLVQGAAAQALAETAEGRAAIFEALGQLVGDRSRLVEPLRGQSLPASAAPVLVGLVKEGGADGAVAATLLAELQAPEAIPAIVELLAQDTVVGRRELLGALGRTRSADAVPALGRELFSDSPTVRAAAVEALALIGAPARAQLEALDALKGDYSLRVRTAAAEAVQALSPPEGAR